ncbi:hypothetical protein SD80_007015 [Scytonema tolypothrichoides VB-61278]|nr:hypothetical protein SD80_007015 [Scytonema tolypothrichoides VB-61278]
MQKYNDEQVKPAEELQELTEEELLCVTGGARVGVADAIVRAVNIVYETARPTLQSLPLLGPILADDEQ